MISQGQIKRKIRPTSSNSRVRVPTKNLIRKRVKTPSANLFSDGSRSHPPTHLCLINRSMPWRWQTRTSSSRSCALTPSWTVAQERSPRHVSLFTWLEERPFRSQQEEKLPLPASQSWTLIWVRLEGWKNRVILRTRRKLVTRISKIWRSLCREKTVLDS